MRVTGLIALLLLVATPNGAAPQGGRSVAAARLDGPELTPVGAERAGNTQGTIPAWTGGISEPPAAYVRGKHHPDPFAADEVLFRITADNLDEYAEQLSEGQKGLLRAHPETYGMDVYPTRRSAAYPARVYEAIVRNASQAVLVTKGKGSVRNASVSSPFPIPESGLEVLWNHLLRFRGQRVSRILGTAAVTRAGDYRIALELQELAFPYAFPDGSPFKERFHNTLLAVKGKSLAPALLVGEGRLIIEPIDRTRSPRKVWAYSRGLRRIVRLPYFGYDFPDPNSDGLRTVDDVDLFNGAPDRFEWKLLGKREVYIPYNAYRLHSNDLSAKDILARSHVNPDVVRYELHRVWVVEGTLHPDADHIYSRRVFYIDEDSWQIALADSYDRQGRLWRLAEAHALNYYEVPVLWETLTVYYDLRQRRYFAAGVDNSRRVYQFSDDANTREFTPNALNYYVR